MLKVLNKASKSVYEKDEVFVNLYNQVKIKILNQKRRFACCYTIY